MLGSRRVADRGDRRGAQPVDPRDETAHAPDVETILPYPLERVALSLGLQRESGFLNDSVAGSVDDIRVVVRAV
jgi:hypothetical protein